MTAIFHSVFLGIVQGLTEFLPISSSAHLNIFPWLFKWTDITESFDLALHLGTLLAILIYFCKDWVSIISGGVKTVVKGEHSAEGRIFWYLVASTIPAGVLGIVLEKVIDKIVSGNMNLMMMIISVALIVMGIILYLVDSRAKSRITYERMNFKQGFLIGLSQAIAGAIPGVSRSGITMTVARSFGLDRESAAKYSFLLSAPMVAGAVLASAGDFTLNVPFIIGVVASFISGLFVIKFLMNYLRRGSYKIFATYRVVIGVAIFVIAAVRM